MPPLPPLRYPSAAQTPPWRAPVSPAPSPLAASLALNPHTAAAALPAPAAAAAQHPVGRAELHSAAPPRPQACFPDDAKHGRAWAGAAPHAASLAPRLLCPLPPRRLRQ
eukprot:scaffold1912_cov20-Tisochrysis_lutea.AAC.1